MGNTIENNSNSINQFIYSCKHPLSGIFQTVRETILLANPKITENIKWNAPNFCFNNIDRITFNLNRPEYLLLIFHFCVKTNLNPDLKTNFKDPDKMLTWIAKDRATYKISNLEDFVSSKNKFQNLVNSWLIYPSVS